MIDLGFQPMIAGFVFNDAWFAVLMVIHVVGAVVGLGPSFAFPVIGKMQETAEGPAALTLLEVSHKIEKTLVTPIVAVVQLVTGVGLIFNRGLDRNFFGSQNGWLVGALFIYVIALGLATGVMTPAMSKMITMAKGGQAGSPEFLALVGKVKKVGPILTLMGLAIVVLMAWKPGSGCGALLRC